MVPRWALSSKHNSKTQKVLGVGDLSQSNLRSQSEDFESNLN